MHGEKNASAGMESAGKTLGHRILNRPKKIKKIHIRQDSVVIYYPYRLLKILFTI